MSRRAGKAQFKLRRRRLGLCFGAGGAAYVAEVESGRLRVHVLEAGDFAAGVRSGRLRARRWRVAMPRRDCLLKRLPLPARDEAEARRMLEFEVPGLVPMHQGGICYDVLPLQAEESSSTNYLVWLSPRDRIEKAVAPLREAGVIPDVVVPDSVALWWLLRSRVAKGGSALLICMDGWCGQVLAVGEGQLEGAREASPAGEGGVDLAVLLTEAQRACGPEEAELEIASRRRVVLAGGGEQVGALADQWRSIRRAAGQADPGCEVLPATVQMGWADGRERMEPLSEVAAMIAAGCVLEEAGAAGEGFNLAPADWQEVRRRRERRRSWAVTAGSAAAVVVLAYVLLAVRIGRLEARKAFIEREMAPIRELATELESKKRRIRMIQAQLSDWYLPLEVLGELYQRVPEGLHLSHLAMDLNPAAPQLAMKGPAGSLEMAFGFPMVLEESPLFCDVRPDAAQQVSRGKGVLIEFGCRCRVTGSRPAVKE